MFLCNISLQHLSASLKHCVLTNGLGIDTALSRGFSFWYVKGMGKRIGAKHDDVIKWKHFLRYWPFVRGIHRLPVNSPHKGQWRGALMFSLICAWINDWVNNREAGDLRRRRAHYDVIVMPQQNTTKHKSCAQSLWKLSTAVALKDITTHDMEPFPHHWPFVMANVGLLWRLPDGFPSQKASDV